MKRIVVADYGSGNVQSVCDALCAVHSRVLRSSDASEIRSADAVVIPGVGSLESFMHSISSAGIFEALLHRVRVNAPTLGICVAMQAVGSGSEEDNAQGLGLIPAAAQSLKSLGVTDLSVPHVGWNSILLHSHLSNSSPLRVLENRDVYFMHAYAFPAGASHSVASTQYGTKFTSAVQIENFIGVQFHPERSQHAGADFLDAWARSV